MEAEASPGRKRAADHPFFEVYQAMITRCKNPRDRRYPRYGGRGIAVCDRWSRGQGHARGFWNFVDDMGPRPEGAALSRRDKDGGYCPENCFWGDFKEQSVNRHPRRPINRAQALSEEERLEVRNMYVKGYSVRQISELYKISGSHCYKIIGPVADSITFQARRTSHR